MCIGVPGQIRTIDGNQAKVDVCGIQRDVDLTLVGSCDENGQPRVGQWVLVHVGFAMSVINEAEARDTLDALQNSHFPAEIPTVNRSPALANTSTSVFTLPM